MDISSNWVLSEYKSEITVLPYDSLVKLIGFNVAKGGVNTLLNWDTISPVYDFFYDYEENEEEITSFLYTSELAKYNQVILIYEPKKPAYMLNTTKFIENWENFVSADGYTGLAISSNDGSLLMEFTDDRSYQLLSNFTIREKSAASGR